MAPKGSEIRTVDLVRRFGERVAIDRLNLEIARGETFGLLGSNGAGKTTLLRLLTGYLLPSAGSISVDGYSPVTDGERVRARLGYVAETPLLYRELRVEGFLRFSAEVRGIPKPELEQAIERSIERFGLAPVARRLIGNLSKGYHQRVSLAQAFLHDPPLLLVDEPTQGLDPLQQAEVRQVIASTRGERTVLLCTHDLAEARELAGRVGVLSEGRLVALGATREILGGADPLALFRDPAEAP